MYSYMRFQCERMCKAFFTVATYQWLFTRVYSLMKCPIFLVSETFIAMATPKGRDIEVNPFMFASVLLPIEISVAKIAFKRLHNRVMPFVTF